MPLPLAQLLPALLWLGLAATGSLDGYALSAAFAIFVAFPTALALDTDVPGWLRRAAAILGPVASSSLLLPRGGLAALVAGTWLLVTLPHLAFGFLRFLSDTPQRRATTWAEAAASVGPVVSSIALLTSRYDGTFAGFPEPLATLTVTHFHFTFGLWPLAVSALVRRGLGAEWPVWGIVGMPPVVGLALATRADHGLPGSLEAVLILLLGLVPLAWLVGSWRRLTLPIARLAALALCVGVALAPAFAVGMVLGKGWLDIPTMLRLHGVTNALALTTLGLVAGRHARFHVISAVRPRPDPDAPTRDVTPARALFLDTRVVDLGPATPGRFDRVAAALLAYHFYPDHIMQSAAAFKDEGRPARVGDRIGMCLLVKLFPGLPAARFPATTEVNVAEVRPGHAAFGYLTTTAHYGAGAWSASLHEADGRLILTLRSRMRPSHPLALIGLPVYRAFQLRAHKAGAARLGAVV